MSNWNEIYITDKTGKRGWVTNCTDWGLRSEKKNLQQHVDMAKIYPEHYSSWDINSMKVVSPSEIDFTLDDLDLLESLGV